MEPPPLPSPGPEEPLVWPGGSVPADRRWMEGNGVLLPPLPSFHSLADNPSHCHGDPKS